MKELYADVIINNNTRALDKTFQYLVPAKYVNQVKVGSLVLVPFGRTFNYGYVIELTHKRKYHQLKEIKEIGPSSLNINQEAIEISYWMSHYYLTTKNKALRMFIPSGVFPEKAKKFKENKWDKTTAVLEIERDQVFEIIKELERKAPRQKRVVDLLLKGYNIPISELVRQAQVDITVIKRLNEKGIISFHPFIPQNDFEPQKVVLNAEQKKVYHQVRQAIEQNIYQSFLLFGVTGSGKTEVYMELMDLCIKLGLQSILVLPEIFLTHQIVKRVRKRFDNQLVVLHSKLTPKERFKAWQEIKSGKKKIVIGARSAIFAPTEKLGIIILDEEHDSSYKQENDPRYNAREIAVKRAHWHKCPVLFGSATPSLESFKAAQDGKMKLLQLKNRVMDYKLPEVQVVDMRDELRSGNANIFSYVLQNHINKTLVSGKQIILYLNRRGFASFVLCQDCGHVIKCVNCEVTLTYHRTNKKLLCHYCGYNRNVPADCPQCGSIRWKPFGMGTQKIEYEFKKLFPGVDVIRIDGDISGKRDRVMELLDDFAKEKVQVLIGTQMVAKGLDFPNVTLVGVIDADTTLNIPDFRSRERSFQLLTQVAGRAGRNQWHGNVVIQTFNPQDISIIHAKNQDYFSFYQQEIKFRQAWHYPPFSQVIRFLIVGGNEEDVATGANIFYNYLKSLCDKKGVFKIEFLGPNPCGLVKLNKEYRWQLILKLDRSINIKPIIKDSLNKFFQRENISRKITINVDVNPNHFV